MTTSRAADLLREPGQQPQATYLELFFDLVFIFALTRISLRLVEDVTSERRIVLTEAGQTLLLLLAVWTIWQATARITNLYDPLRPAIQALVIATMFGTLVMAVTLPEAFGARGLAFASAYVAIQITRSLILVLALHGREVRRRAARLLFWAGVSAIPWIAGALFPESTARAVLWTLALAVDYTGSILGLPAPWLGRTALTKLPVLAEHLAERYRQFSIVALGELILIIGITYSGSGFTPGQTVAFVVAFTTTVLLWRIYTHRAGQLLAAAIETARYPGRIAIWTSLAHLLMLAGIVLIAVGDELVITHPYGHTDPAWIAVILGGPALFVAGRAIFEYGVFGRVSLSRVIAVLVLAALTPGMRLGPPLSVAIAATLVLAGIVIADATRSRGHPKEQPSPPSGGPS